jgi:hypothetical protein
VACVQLCLRTVDQVVHVVFPRLPVSAFLKMVGTHTAAALPRSGPQTDTMRLPKWSRIGLLLDKENRKSSVATVFLSIYLQAWGWWQKTDPMQPSSRRGSASLHSTQIPVLEMARGSNT